MNQEEAFVRSFILLDKQSRYLEMLASPKRRDGFLDCLNHHLDYDPSYAIQVPSSQQKAASIEALLRQRGAPEICHTISSLSKWDGLDLGLHEALEMVVGYNIGTVLCCTSGRLAYYESEDIRERYILFR
ncbi:MAG TPA: hypothetical protein VGO67_20385 [Verrucomicrobiae bacterium]